MSRPVITAAVGRLADLPDHVREVDEVELDSDDRTRGHQRIQTRAGRELRLSLPRGCELEEGDVLLVEADTAVVVRAAAEDVLQIEPASERQWGQVGYGLGNLHRPARFGQRAILTPYDAASEALVRHLGAAYRRASQPFVGARVGAMAHHHAAGDQQQQPHGEAA